MFSIMLWAANAFPPIAAQFPEAAPEPTGYLLPLTASMLALMPLVAAVVAELRRRVPVIEKNHKWALPLLSVAIGVGLAFVTAQPEPIQDGLAVGVATCYAYDLIGGGIKQLTQATQ